MSGIGGGDSEVKGYTYWEFSSMSSYEGAAFKGAKGAEEQMGVKVWLVSAQIYDRDWCHFGLVFPVGVHGFQDVFFEDF